LKKEHKNLLFVSVGLLAVLTVDFFIPTGVAVGVLYVLFFLCLLSTENITYFYYFSLLTTTLIVIGSLLHSIEEITCKAILNRAISIIAIWTITFIIVFYKNSIDFQNVRLRRKQIRISTVNEELINKNKELEQFAYIASHDLQEPLRTVSSFAQILKSNYENEIDTVGQKSLAYMTHATERMSLLIKGLLDYSRIGKDKTLETFDTNQMVNEIRQDLANLIRDKKAVILGSDLPLITAYKTDIRLLFQNLISNGIKFSRPEVDPIIHIKCVENQSDWSFSVSDNGIGINQIYFERIFVIFQRLHDKQEYEGTGIGLSHCQKIVHLHGGKISLDSELNKGSTFSFNIIKPNPNDAQA